MYENLGEIEELKRSKDEIIMILRKTDLNPDFNDEDFERLWPSLRKLLEGFKKKVPNRVWVRVVANQAIKIGDFIYNKGNEKEITI